MGRSDLPKTTSVSRSQGCSSAMRSLWVGGAGCHSPWAVLEAAPCFWSWLILETISHPASQGGTQITHLPVGKHPNCEKDFIGCHFPLGLSQEDPAAQAAGQASPWETCPKAPCRSGTPFGSNTPWGAPVVRGSRPLPTLRRCLRSFRESSLSPQGGARGWQQWGCIPVGCGSSPPAGALLGCPLAPVGC